MSDMWTISVAGRSYGPYTAAQMQGFAVEGRLAPQSLVARGDENQFRAAGDDAVLAQFFRPATPAPTPQPAPAPQRPQFFTAEGNEEIQSFGRSEDDAATGQ